MNSSLPPSGWYPDPAGTGDERFWDGENWSQATRPRTQTPPLQPEPGASAQPYARNDAYGAPPAHARPAPHLAPGPGAYGYQPRPAMRVAGWWWRVLAYILDGVLISFVLSFVQTPLMSPAMPAYEAWLMDVISGRPSQFPEEMITVLMWSGLISMAFWVLYRTLMVAWKGATVGQLIVGLRVVRDGDQSLAVPSWGTAAGRAVLSIILFNIPIVGLVNALWPLFNDKRQALHDLAVKTVVLKKN